MMSLITRFRISRLKHKMRKIRYEEALVYFEMSDATTDTGKERLTAKLEDLQSRRYELEVKREILIASL